MSSHLSFLLSIKTMSSVSASLKLAEQHLCALRYYGGLSRKPKGGWVVHKTNDVMREFSNLTKERKGFRHGWLCSCPVCRPVGNILSSSSNHWDLQNTIQRSESAEFSLQAIEVVVLYFHPAVPPHRQMHRVIHLLSDTRYAQYSRKATILEVNCA